MIKYVITGVNKLTQEREIISQPMAEWKAEMIIKKAKSRALLKRSKPAYSRLKKERLEGLCLKRLFDEN
jgi:hypothetical protein